MASPMPRVAPVTRAVWLSSFGRSCILLMPDFGKGRSLRVNCYLTAPENPHFSQKTREMGHPLIPASGEVNTNVKSSGQECPLHTIL